MTINTILFTLLIATCAFVQVQGALIAPPSAFARAESIYGTTLVQDEITHVTLAFYNASGYQINPATINISTVSVRVANGGRIFNIASSGYGIQFDAYLLTSGAQSFIININGATVNVPIQVNATTFASARIRTNEFNVSTAYRIAVAFYKPSGAQINPQVIDISSVSIQSQPAGITVTDIASAGEGIQFTLSFSAPGYYTIYINLNGQRVSVNATVLPASAPAKTCIGVVQFVQRTGNGGSWTSENTDYKIFDVSVVNQGTCSITSAALPFYFIGTITSSWNLRLDSPQGYGSVVVYTPIAPGTIYTGAGFIIANYTTYSGHYSASPVMCSSC